MSKEQEQQESRELTAEERMMQLENALSMILQEFFFTPGGKLVKEWFLSIALGRTFTPDAPHPSMSRLKLEEVAFEEGKRFLALKILELSKLPVTKEA